MADDRSTSGPGDDPLRTLSGARAETAGLVEDLRTELGAIGESTEAGPDDEHDAEGSTVGYERSRVKGLLERAERTLADIDAAVERVEDGTYGICVGCGRAIGAERLAVLPTATRCARCAATVPRVPWPRPGNGI